NEQLLIGIARFFICERLVFAQPHFYELVLILNENQNQTVFNGRGIISKLVLKRTVRFDMCE
ncbi:TPA: hypothetical protein ACGO9X_000638, partial [Streptococcus suis]